MKLTNLLIILLSIILISCVSIEDEVKRKAEANVSYLSEDGTTINAYLSLPEEVEGAPAVLMIHEWWGLNEDIEKLADALAAEGFAVLAADAFRGDLATSVPAAIVQVRSTPQSQIHADLDAALEYLRSRPEVDGDRVGVMGFCFGGRHSMQLGTRATGLSGVVTLYGSDPITDPNDLGNMAANGPVLGIFGETDSSIPLSKVSAFESALDEAGAENTISVYPDIGHAFVKSSTYRNDGAPGEAWKQLVSFFNETL